MKHHALVADTCVSKADAKFYSVASVRWTNSLWFVLFLSVIVALTHKLESRVFYGSSKSHSSVSFVNHPNLRVNKLLRC
jgi:hypothetical protein